MTTQTENVIKLIIAERINQVAKNGYTLQHDDDQDQNELIFAAISYLSHAKGDRGVFEWPWPDTPFKPSTDDLANLASAAALIVAEIERVIRLNGQQIGIVVPTNPSIDGMKKTSKTAEELLKTNTSSI